MKSSLKISKEERFLINILFEKKIDESIFKKINYENLVKISSSHLVLPALYLKLKKKKYLTKTPNDFKSYLEFIYKHNSKNNQKLIEETKTIKNILKKNKIKYCLLKGANYILNDLYSDIGERMIGDIDFLIEKDNYDKVCNLFYEKGYKNKYNYKLWKTKHAPRLISSKKQFALEVHFEGLLYRKRYLLTGKRILKNKQPDGLNLVKLCILNYQINDYGSLKASYSYRVIYDFMLLINKYNIDIKLLNNKHYRKFFIILNELKIKDFNFNSNISDNFFLVRFRLLNKFIFFRFIDHYFCEIIKNTPIVTMQILEFVVNKKYRINVINKLRAANQN